MTQKNIALAIAAVGLGLNVIDGVTAKGNPAGGVLYGPEGALKPLNDRMPVSVTVGTVLLFVGGGLWLALQLRRRA